MKFGKKNFKRILVYIFILSCLSPILYFHYPKLFPIHRGGYLRGTEYESLERFHTGNHGDMEIFKVEGIVYNVNFEDSTKVSFDINAWDVKMYGTHTFCSYANAVVVRIIERYHLKDKQDRVCIGDSHNRTRDHLRFNTLDSFVGIKKWRDQVAALRPLSFPLQSCGRFCIVN